MKFQVYHMRNETSFDECRETVSERAQPTILLNQIEERCLEIWARVEWKEETDWIEIYPVRKEK